MTSKKSRISLSEMNQAVAQHISEIPGDENTVIKAARDTRQIWCGGNRGYLFLTEQERSRFIGAVWLKLRE